MPLWRPQGAVAEVNVFRATDAMAEIYILVYLGTTLLIFGPSIAPFFLLFRNLYPGHHVLSDKSGTSD